MSSWPRRAIDAFYDVGRGGICHQVLPENGHVRPGMVVVGTDSHMTTHGAFGAFSVGIGATEMAGVWTEGKLWFKVPSTLRIEVEGEFRPWISAKDLILYIIGLVGATGADYRAVEFDGSAVRRLTVASRMVLTNLATEMGAKAAFTPVDEVLLDYLRPRVSQKLEMLGPDAHAVYERVIRLDAGRELREPQIACPHAVDNVRPLSSLGDVPVDQAVVGSCTNGRLEDLAAAAQVVAGHTVHPHTRLHRDSRLPANLSGSHAAGISGDAGGGRRHHQPAGLRAVRGGAPGHSRGRRDLRLIHQSKLPGAHGQQGFPGVPGQPGRGGRVRDRRQAGASGRPSLEARNWQPWSDGGGVMKLGGRVRAVLGDNIDTDVIYPGRYLNITDREKTAGILFELVYPEIRAALEPGDIIVAAKNFGGGSSREQAAAALKFAGVGAVIAASFGRIFLRNAINLGLPAVVSAGAAARCAAGDELEIDLDRRGDPERDPGPRDRGGGAGPAGGGTAGRRRIDSVSEAEVRGVKSFSGRHYAQTSNRVVTRRRHRTRRLRRCAHGPGRGRVRGRIYGRRHRMGVSGARKATRCRGARSIC